MGSECGEEGEGKTPDFFSDVSDPPVVGYILRMQRTHLTRTACCCGLHFIRIHRTHLLWVTFQGCGRPVGPGSDSDDER